MKHILILAFMIIPISALAGDGPTSLGKISIGMSKSDYISAIGTNPVNCNTYKDRDGKSKRSEMKYLRPDSKTLCWGLDTFGKMSSIENIKVSGISYDVIEADSLSSIGGSSEYLKQFGHSSKAIFLDDKLIYIEIYSPSVGLETLNAKYGDPKLVDNREVEVCKNRMGNEFKNEVGNLDAVWVNGKVQAILRAHTSSPRETCTDGISVRYYILQEPEQLKIIENAITAYREKLSKEEVKDSPF